MHVRLGLGHELDMPLEMAKFSSNMLRSSSNGPYIM